MIKVEDNDKVVTRLQIASGHLSSIIKMLESGRPTAEVIQQLAAVRAAIGKINVLVYNREVETLARKMRNTASDQECWQEAQELLNIFRIQSH